MEDFTMSYSPDLSSAFNDTSMRSRHLSPLSGMCSFCTQECPGTCEIALAAVLGKQTVYPTNTGNNQVASEKDYPIDFSHFNINGRVFGADGAGETYEEANIYRVNLNTSYGIVKPVEMTMPIILPALIKLNWQDYFGGAAMAGVTCVIGEEARFKDPALRMEKGKVVQFPALQTMLDAFRRYDRGYGQIVLQCNVEDDMLGIPELALDRYQAHAIEFKLGQSAKGTQPARRLRGRAEAIEKQEEGMLVFPDPLDPAMEALDLEGNCPGFYSYARLPLWDEACLIPRIRELRERGATHLYLKMAGYDRKDLERVLRMGSEAGVDMITFDGAGGGTGYSPTKMMNEWGLPAILMQEALLGTAKKLKAENRPVPAITVTGGFSSEDQVFKSLALGDGSVTAVGLCRAAMAAAMTGENVGRQIREGKVPRLFRGFGTSVEEIYADLADLRSLYGKRALEFSLGAVGVFSYLNKIAFGLKHLAALNRKFDLSRLDRSDLIPLTLQARELLRGSWFDS